MDPTYLEQHKRAGVIRYCDLILKALQHSQEHMASGILPSSEVQIHIFTSYIITVAHSITHSMLNTPKCWYTFVPHLQLQRHRNQLLLSVHPFHMFHFLPFGLVTC